ncbi:amino acid ABC transporter substrate-binding protein, PAAT family [Andreprevotia lacus DSM 23236]|jgi:glutamate/aspartate transport system substrate-binding protein|uniref:Amino acid ABC transporter substrate-binding protein, PAAT family n=1 Tax=Andreprevotia lacus DSM 23236 TaxID=1121001 RepID=A0A1W1Y0A1_9NEIS|nr:transporter substrate-binding domain-containing protein [Andreprevotia lacus]SMC29562.1 amino acid ABC transporter substrate-binding protein, PAAT family [Andreprevotia lacus DSM 23236]
MRKLIPLVAALTTVFACTAQAEELTGTLKKIKDSGTIVVGVRDASQPFSYLVGNKQYVGYSVDLCNHIVDAVQKSLKLKTLEVTYQPVTSSTRIPLMQNGTIDLECGSTTNSIERQKQVAFGVNMFLVNVRMAVKASSGIKSVADLNGKPVVTTTGTTSDRYIKQHEAGQKIDVKNLYGKDHDESFLMLETDRAAAFVMDDTLLFGKIANARNPKDFAVVGEVLSSEPYGIMLRKDDPQFKKLVDDTLTKIYKSDEIQKIYAKWFTSPIPPKNINLNMPMSDKLKQQFANPTDKGV